VLSQSLRTGKSVRYHAGIALVVASPFPHVPSVVSKLRLAAAAALREAGFTVRVTSRTVTSGTENAVLSQTPVGGQSLRPHGLVTIVVAHVVRPVVAPPTSAPPAPSNCTPGYSPCLPPAYDYDCAGGSGDGPKYVYGVETVTGSDPYGLDSDGDGYGCE
jgi:beta-lactam-binding protein with PASTA domain